ncbi:glucocorticoid modulatory element-binding protein 1-like isoform X2 [Colossoma macropomum]|uniref:glucocorticoid modulatory element-binding protein 1-like isoform X2 n=1 Tax=Colossoma macropomum TaxID=42526 RepID=UPI001864E205|nr:glucocorticoid modulatory element-binding protein 1-like isoform X2 [Colossoma macropomum]
MFIMSLEEIVMVKGEEGGHNNNHKAQLILHLQSISQGTHEDIGETSTTLLAVESQQEDNSEGEEVEYGYPITCGDSKAVLLFKKFFNDQLISPKQFVHLAGKATLKDWKRAIRLGGVMLRKMMDSGQIDFYQHETVCTNSCRSTKLDLLINSTRLAPSVLQTCSPLPVMGQESSAEERPEETFSDVVDSCPPQMTPTTNNGEVRMDTEDISDETLSLWKGIAELGLMGEVVSTIRLELLAMLRGVERRSEQATLQEADAVLLNTLTEMFGLLDSVRQVLDLQRNKTDENQHQMHTTLKVFADQLDKQKMMVPISKRPRLQRPRSTSLLTSSASPFTILSPITLTSTSQPLTITGLPVAMLAQLPTDTQLLPHHTGTEAMAVAPPSGITVLSAGLEDRTPTVEVLDLSPGQRGEREGEEEERRSVLDK